MTEPDTNRREALQELLAEEIVKQASDAPLLTWLTDSRRLNGRSLSFRNLHLVKANFARALPFKSIKE